MSSTSKRYDVIVVGAGPGGSLTAMMLAQRGRRVALIDRQRLPRFAIGESSTPICSRVIEQIADDFQLPQIRPLSSWGTWREQLPDLTGGIKRGFTYLDHRHPDACFLDARTMPQASDAQWRLLVAANASDDASDTHWLRCDVDAYLVEVAKHVGVDVFLGHEVTGFTRQSPWSVQLKRTPKPNESMSTQIHDELTCDRLVDASGRAAVLLRALRCDDVTDTLQTETSTTYTHLTGLQAMGLPGESEMPFRPDAAAVHHLVDDGWVWQLPMCDGRASIGRVWNRADAPSGNPMAAKHSDHLNLQIHIELAKYFDNGSLSEPPGSWKSIARVQHRWQTRDRWDAGLLPLPTTIATIDPLHSTGLAHAVTGAQRVVDLILRGTASDIDHYQRQVESEIDRLDEVVSLAYAVINRTDLFFLACMLYFAIAIADEQDRTANGFRRDRAAWLADDASATQTIADAKHCLVQAMQNGTKIQTDSFSQRLRAICTVPLACRTDNLYGYTFAENL